MDSVQRNNHVLSLGLNRMLIDLLFDVTAGEQVDLEWSYEEQLEYYKKMILPEHMNFAELVEYGNKYKLTWKFLFPAKPEKVKKRLFLIKLFSSYVLLNEIVKCNDFELVSNPNKLSECVTTKITFSNEEEQSIYAKEVQYLAKQYAETLTKEDYNEFLAIITKVSEEFEQIYNIVVAFVLGEEATQLESTGVKSVFSILLDTYQIPVSDATKFRLETDAIIETAVIKNEHLEYMEELKAEWGKHFPKYKFGKELEEYVKLKKQPYMVAYGNNISLLRNESFLFLMLADVTVKLALVEGAKNVADLTQKIKDLTIQLGDNIKDIFIESRKNVVRGYHLAYRGEYPSDIANVLIPYRTDLMYLRDIIIEEISFRNAGNIVQKQSKKTKDIGEYELLLSQKDAEIYDLKRELEYYENIKQQEFKAEVSQYNKALTDLFRKMCDFKYNSPLNELYLLANTGKEIKSEEIKGVLQNLLFILSTMNIVPYETGNVGKKVKFYDDEANIVYAVDENKVKEGLNKGVQVYPGWKYKEAELVLPRVDVEE